MEHRATADSRTAKSVGEPKRARRSCDEMGESGGYHSLTFTDARDFGITVYQLSWAEA